MTQVLPFTLFVSEDEPEYLSTFLARLYLHQHQASEHQPRHPMPPELTLISYSTREKEIHDYRINTPAQAGTYSCSGLAVHVYAEVHCNQN